MIPLEHFDASQLGPNGPISDLSSYGKRFLAEGDSWFTIGSLHLLASANLLQEMAFTQRNVAVNCAAPGDKLARRPGDQRPAGEQRLLQHRHLVFVHRLQGGPAGR